MNACIIRTVTVVWLCVCAPLHADDLLTMKACPPSEEEFVDIFQKIKYSLSLLVRLDCS